MNNYYALLGLEAAATVEEIRKAIHREQRLWANRTNAPDLQRKQEAERRVTLLDEAEAVLLDAAKRTAYDHDLRAQESSRPSQPAPELATSANPVQEAQQLLESGRVADALYIAQRAAESDPRDPDIWWILGRANQEFGETDRAVKCMKRAIAMRPDHPQYLFDLGNIFETVEDWSSAVDCYAQAERIQPDVLMYRAAHGWVLAKMGQAAAAIEILEHCVQQEPDNTAYQWFLAIAYADCAQVGWARVGEGHPVLAPGEYATSLEHVTVAQAALDKALALKFDDEELAKQLTELKTDLDAMKKRHFVGNWAVPSVYGALGLLAGMSPGSRGMLVMVLIAVLYVVSTFVPQYIINRQLVKGKQFNDFRFLGRIADLGKESELVWLPILTFVVIFIISFIALPFFALFNLYRYQGDTIRRLLTSAETKQKLSMVMGTLQSAATGTVAATNAALANIKSTIKEKGNGGAQATAPELVETEQTSRQSTTSPQLTSPVPPQVEKTSTPREQEQSAVPVPPRPRAADSAGIATTETVSAQEVEPARSGSSLLASIGAKPLVLGIGAVLVVGALILLVAYFRKDTATTASSPAAEQVEQESAQTTETALSNARKCMESGDTSCAKAIADSILAQSPTNPEAIEIRDAVSAVELKSSAEKALEAGQRCLAAGDFNCAREFAAKALGADAADAAARELLEDANAAEVASNISVLLSKADACLAKGDTACVEASTNEALQHDPANVRALMIKQEAASANRKAALYEGLEPVPETQARESGASGESQVTSSGQSATVAAPPAPSQVAPRTAKKPDPMKSRIESLVASNLAEGQNCLRLLNFECAIARAETALQLDPDNGGALELRDDAREEQKKAFEESGLE